MKKITNALILVAIVLGMGFLAVPAHAAKFDTNPNRCTVQEFRAVKMGYRKWRVDKIMDGHGRLMGVYIDPDGGYVYRQFWYGKYPKNYKCQIGFTNHHVTDKARS